MPQPEPPARPARDAEQASGNLQYERTPAVRDFIARLLDRFQYMTRARAMEIFDRAVVNQRRGNDLQLELDILSHGGTIRRPGSYRDRREAVVNVIIPGGEGREAVRQVRIDIRREVLPGSLPGTAAAILEQAREIAGGWAQRYGWNLQEAIFEVRYVL